MESTEPLKDSLQVQLDELEALRSMFCNPGELRLEDVCTPIDMQNYINSKTEKTPPQCLDFTINLQIEEIKFEVCVTLPHSYPETEPEIYVRNSNLNRIQHNNLNKDLTAFVESLDRNEPCIFSAVSWLQDNYNNYYVELKGGIANQELANKNEDLIRYWIYSHHIYSKTKRRAILDLAHSMNITGFSLPGKPGIICVEGFVSDVTEWWQSIKSMNWKRIFCKVTEECKDDFNAFRKFDCFQEVVFQNNSIKCNHMDMGELLKFLEDRKCAYIFKELFGVDAKFTSQ